MSASRASLRRLGRLAAIAVAVAALMLVAEDRLAALRVAENWSLDARVAALTPPAGQADDLAVVAVTEETLEGLAYRSPLDRGMLRELLAALAAQRVRAVGLDVLFTRPTEPEKDRALRELLGSIGVPVVIAALDPEDGLGDRQSAFQAGYLRGLPTGLAVAYQDAADGVVRSVLLRRADGRGERLGFAAALARAAGAAVPAGEELTIAFRGAPARGTSAFPVYPAHLVAALPPGWMAGKIVLVGADLPFSDRHRTPLSAARAAAGDPRMPGVLIHAHALSQILEGREHAEVGAPGRAALLLLAAAAGVALATAGASVTVIVLGSLLLAAGGWIAGFAAYAFDGPLVPLVSPTLAFVVAVTLSFGLRWRRERGQRRFVERAFSKFVPPAVVSRLIENPDLLKVGGEQREVTFLFTDLTDFMGLSQRLDPRALLALMNEYFDGAFRIVLEHEGTIDRIVGDAVAVMFNAPLPQPDHPARAVRCALALDAWCHGFAERQRARGIAFGETRIGVNTGDVVVGNYGGQVHFEYSATGDAINVTARLESANRHLGTRVCVSASTAARVPDVAFRPVGRLVLRGRPEPLEAFEPVPAAGAGDLERYRAVHAALDGDPAAARAALDAWLADHPDDPLARFHAARLAAGEGGTRVVLAEK